MVNLIKHHLCIILILIEKIDGCENSPEKLSTAKVSEHIPVGFTVSTISFKDIENKHDVYRGKDCMKRLLSILQRACNEDN